MTKPTKPIKRKTATPKPKRTARGRRQRAASLAKKRAAIDAARGQWQASTQAMLVVEGKKATLGLIVQPLDNEYGRYWTAGAVVTPHVKGDGGVQLVLDAHEHKLLGDHPTEVKAKAACEEFAKEWRKTEAVGDLCGCGEIVADAPLVGGSSISHPLVATKTTTTDEMNRARVVVDEHGVVIKNSYGPTGGTVYIP